MLAKTALVLLATFISHAMADCPMPSSPQNLRGSPDGGKTVNDEKVCRTQGGDSWTFVMQTSGVDVPSGGAGGIAGGYAGGTVFAVLDNTCTVRGTYEKPDCQIPYTIGESFMQYLIVKEINTAVGGGYFKFAYGDGEYSIGNDHCKCNDVSSGLQGAQSCGCAFPINGNSHGKRDMAEPLVSIPFKA